MSEPWASLVAFLTGLFVVVVASLILRWITGHGMTPEGVAVWMLFYVFRRDLRGAS